MFKKSGIVRFDRRRVLFATYFFMMGCMTAQVDYPADNIPMYGQTGSSRAEFLKNADAGFIKQATTRYGGNREVASKAWAEEAKKFMSRGNVDEAMRRYNQAWLLNPDNYEPYWGFGRAMLERGKIDEAIEHFETAKKLCSETEQKIAIISDTGEAYSYKAQSLSEDAAQEKRHYFKLANQHFMVSTKLEPGYTHGWAHWAHSLYREGKYLESWEIVKKARSLGARDTEALVENLQKQIPELASRLVQ